MYTTHNRLEAHTHRYPNWFTYVKPDRFINVMIKYGDGVHKAIDVEWWQGMTVLDALKQSCDRSHGLDVEYRGTGDNAFVIRIDDLTNQGDGPNCLNWLYSVEEQMADVGCGKRLLYEFSQVMWQFGPMRRFSQR